MGALCRKLPGRGTKAEGEGKGKLGQWAGKGRVSGYKTLAGESDGLHCCNAGLHKYTMLSVECKV